MSVTFARRADWTVDVAGLAGCIWLSIRGQTNVYLGGGEVLAASGAVTCVGVVTVTRLVMQSTPPRLAPILLALFVAICCLTRLVLETAGKSRAALDAVGPLSFLVLIAVMAVLSFRGILGADPASQREAADTYDRVDDRER